ncbi:hypothetical protein GQ42DRAFT_162028 [Ramicandelaber brevisporus]|nr:hypothetical protein GQ42DRAFT_162028 [Ramicandelaber brevisporus]
MSKLKSKLKTILRAIGLRKSLFRRKRTSKALNRATDSYRKGGYNDAFHLLGLPDDILWYLAKYLSRANIVSLLLTCRVFHTVFENEVYMVHPPIFTNRAINLILAASTNKPDGADSDGGGGLNHKVRRIDNRRGRLLTGDISSSLHLCVPNLIELVFDLKYGWYIGNVHNLKQLQRLKVCVKDNTILRDVDTLMDDVVKCERLRLVEWVLRDDSGNKWQQAYYISKTIKKHELLPSEIKEDEWQTQHRISMYDRKMGSKEELNEVAKYLWRLSIDHTFRGNSACCGEDNYQLFRSGTDVVFKRLISLRVPVCCCPLDCLEVSAERFPELQNLTLTSNIASCIQGGNGDIRANRYGFGNRYDMFRYHWPRHMTNLDIEGQGIWISMFDGIVNELPSLQCIRVCLHSVANMEGSIFYLDQYAEKLPMLRELAVSGANSIIMDFDGGYPLPLLQRLELSSMKQVSDATFLYILRIPRLYILRLTNAPISAPLSVLSFCLHYGARVNKPSDIHEFVYLQPYPGEQFILGMLEHVLVKLRRLGITFDDGRLWSIIRKKYPHIESTMGSDAIMTPPPTKTKSKRRLKLFSRNKH